MGVIRPKVYMPYDSGQDQTVGTAVPKSPSCHSLRVVTPHA
jgi:hypothetical protein